MIFFWFLVLIRQKAILFSFTEKFGLYPTPEIRAKMLTESGITQFQLIDWLRNQRSKKASLKKKLINKLGTELVSQIEQKSSQPALGSIMTNGQEYLDVAINL